MHNRHVQTIHGKNIYMANRLSKRCLVSLDMREMQVQTTVRWCNTPIRRTKIKQKKITPNAGESMEKLHHSYIGNVKWYSRSEKEFVSFFKKVNMCSTYNSSTALWAFIPESENLYHKKTYAWMLVAAWLVIAQTCKQLRCSSTVHLMYLCLR